MRKHIQTIIILFLEYIFFWTHIQYCGFRGKQNALHFYAGSFFAHTRDGRAPRRRAKSAAADLFSGNLTCSNNVHHIQDIILDLIFFGDGDDMSPALKQDDT